MSDPFLIPIATAVAGTTLVLVIGLATLWRPLIVRDPATGERPRVSRSNQLMRARVLTQAVAVLLILAGAAWKKAHHGTGPAEAGTRPPVTLAQAPSGAIAGTPTVTAGKVAP